MKYLTTVLLILMLSVSVACAGQATSDLDQSWEITVTDCQGNTTIYHECRILNDGLNMIKFMPNQGKIPTYKGPAIKVYRSNCTEIIMISE